MEIQVGDRVVWKYTDENNVHTEIVCSEDSANSYNQVNNKKLVEILKIERPKYEVVEEKKELLTEEERKTLKEIIDNVNKFSCVKVQEVYFDKHDEYTIVYFSTPELQIADIMVVLKFKLLEGDTSYTLSELGLED